MPHHERLSALVKLPRARVSRERLEAILQIGYTLHRAPSIRSRAWIIHLRYCTDPVRTFDEISTIVGLSPGRCKNLARQGIGWMRGARMRPVLEAAGVLATDNRLKEVILNGE